MEDRTAKRATKAELRNRIASKIIASKDFSSQVKKLSQKFDDQKNRIMRILAEKSDY